jgi:valyl-tRNA synthetase
MRLEDYVPDEKIELELLDKWILSKLEKVVKKTTEALEICDFMNAIETTRNFVWHVFCDHWLEAAKTRLYGDDDTKISAQQTMYYALPRILKLLAPIMPHITEEIYRTMFAKSSIHISNWPDYQEDLIGEEIEKIGNIIIESISDVRRAKNRKGISLNKQLSKVIFYAEEKNAEILNMGAKDIKETIKVDKLEITSGSGEIKLVNYPEIEFTMII